MAELTSGWSMLPGCPREIEKSLGPTNRQSTSGSAAISSRTA